MSSYKGVVVVKNAGKKIPDAVVEALLLNYTSCVGMAIASKSKDGKPIVDLVRTSIAALPDSGKAMRDIQTKFENRKVMFYFGEFPEGFSKEDMQPFSVLVDQANKTAVACCLVGDFEEAGPEADGKSKHYLEIQEYVTPKLLALYEGCKYDVNRFMGQVRDKTFRKELEGYFDSACVAILANNDDLLTMSKQKGVQTDWGFMSSDPAVVEKEATPPVVDEPGELDGVFGIPAEPAAAPVKADPVTTKAATKPPKLQVASTEPIKAHPPGGTPIAKKEVVETQMRAPDPKMSNKQKKKWYNQNVGYVPADWQDCPTVPVKVKRSFSGLDPENGEAIKEQLASTTAQPKVLKVASAEPTPKPASVPSVQPADQPQPQERREPMPVVPAAAKEKFLDHFLKGKQVALLDRNAESILTLDFKSFQSELPTYTDIARLPNLEAAINQLQSYEDRMDLIKNHPENAERVLCQAFSELVQKWHMDLNKKSKPAATQEIKPTEQPSSQVHRKVPKVAAA